VIVGETPENARVKKTRLTLIHRCLRGIQR